MGNKVREFFVYEIPSDSKAPAVRVIREKEENAFSKDWLRIHVIEYSAYEKLQKRVDELEASKIHTCHDDCQRIECVQRRKIEELEAENKKLREVLRRIRHHVVGFKSNGEILSEIDEALGEVGNG